jgi:hypothetical protein
MLRLPTHSAGEALIRGSHSAPPSLRALPQSSVPVAAPRARRAALSSRHGWLCWFVAAWSLGCTAPTEGQTTASAELTNSRPSHRTDVVGILTKGSAGEKLCTGIPLLPNLVLTARHCTGTESSSLESGNCTTAVFAPTAEPARIGVLPGSDVDRVAADQQTDVAELWFRDDEGKLCGEDVALLYLAAAVNGTLAEVTADVPEPGAQFVAVGYGLNEGDWGRQRQNDEAAITCVGEACADARVVADELLATSGACEGDSGGPAIGGDGRVFALASRSNATCSETAYLTLGSHWLWLTSAVRLAASNGQYEVPEWATDAATSTGTEPVAAVHATGARLAGGACSVIGHGSSGRAASLFGIVGLAAAMWVRRRCCREKCFRAL